MRCRICKEKPATVHLTVIKGEMMQKLDFCEDCAKAKGMNENTNDMAEFMLGLDVSQPRRPFES